MHRLPNEVVSSIFHWVDARDLFVLRQVCHHYDHVAIEILVLMPISISLFPLDFRDIELLPVFFPRLQTLTLSRREFCSAEAEIYLNVRAGLLLDRSQSLTSLTLNQFRGHRDQQGPWKILGPHLSHLSGLTGLRIDRGFLGGDSVIALAQLPNLQSLTSLPISTGHVTDDALRYIAQTNAFCNLKTLDLSYNRIARKGLVCLANSAVFSNLTHLDLTENPFYRFDDDEDNALYYPHPLEILGGSLVLQNLTELVLHEIHLGYYGISVLARSPYLVHLRALRLRNTSICDDSLISLGQSCTVTGLTLLDLQQNDLTPRGIAALADSPNFARLADLDLSSCHIENAELEAAC